MATLANIFNQFSGAKTMAAASDAAAARDRSDAFRLRALPNDSVYFYVKKIDNSRVVKQADPRARRSDYKLVGGASLAACALIGVLLPSAYTMMAGYQLNQLQQENQRLTIERSQLELEEAKLVSTERLQKLAEEQQLIDPAPDGTVYLPKSDSSLALNQRR